MRPKDSARWPLLAGGFTFSKGPLASLDQEIAVSLQNEQNEQRPRKRNRRPRQLTEMLAHLDDRVLTIPEWRALNSLSIPTGHRILQGEYGPPPEVVQLSPNRVGITVRANREWQQRRARGA